MSSFPLSNQPLSYPSLMAIIPYLSFSQRMKLSSVSPLIRKIHKRLDYSLNSMMFFQKHGPVNDDGEAEEVGSGVLHVESIEYLFEYNEMTQNVTIECTLRPGKAKISNQKSIARLYFEYFLNSSKRPIQHLELKECDSPFRNLSDLKIPSISWTLNGGMEYPQLLNFSSEHVFEKLEFINFNLILLTENKVRNCKHLVLQNKQIYAEFVIGNEEHSIRNFYCLLENKEFEVALGLNHVESFILLCGRLLTRTINIGSSFTAIFEKSGLRKNFVWNSLFEQFENATKGILKGKECVVLELENEWIVAIFHNYFNEDNDQTESFTAIKLERNIEPDDENILEIL